MGEKFLIKINNFQIFQSIKIVIALRKLMENKNKYKKIEKNKKIKANLNKNNH